MYMYVTIIEFVLIRATCDVLHTYLKSQYMYVIIMGFTYMYIVLLLLPFFIIACTLYTSQYRSKSKDIT